MPFDFSAYEVAVGEKPASSAKFNNFLVAVQGALNGMPIANLAGYPSDSAKFLRGDGTWATPATDLAASYVKTTTTTSTGDLIAHDIFGGAFTIGAGKLSATGAIKIFASGSYTNNTGAGRTLRAALKLGATTLWDSGASSTLLNDATPRGWYFAAYIQALAATNAQRGGGILHLTDFGAATTGFGQLNGGGVQANFATAAGAVNMAGAQALVLEVTHSNAGCTISCFSARVEVTT